MFDSAVNSWLGHLISLGVILGYFASVVPALATSATFVYFLIEIYQSPTFKEFLRAHQTRAREKKLAALLAKEKVVSAEIAALTLLRVAKNDASALLANEKSAAAALVVQAAASDVINNLPPKIE